MFILKNIEMKIYLMRILLMVSMLGFSQNIQYSFTSNFAKLQNDLEKEFGRDRMHTITFSELSEDSVPYSLQIFGNSEYVSFLEKSKIHNAVRILYLNNINFKKIEDFGLDELSHLRAIKINNCKNIDFKKLISELFLLKELEQLHFENLKFGNWDLNVNRLEDLKVLTINDCLIDKFSNISLTLDEFSISGTKKTLDLNTLFIKSVEKVEIKDCKINVFPYNLSTSKGLVFLDLEGTEIKKGICNDIKGFESLLYLDISNAKINFKSVEFTDTKERLFVIKGAEVYSPEILDSTY